MEKIEIIQVAENVFTHKGFSYKGCFSSDCMDNCCRRGCDMDRETFDLVMQQRETVEKILGLPLKSCFEREWSGKSDFLGRDSISTMIIKGTCAFHLARGKGCVLWQMVHHHNCSGRIIPSTCRLYPITWDNGVMRLVDCIEKECNCIDPCNYTYSNLWESQKEAIEDIFVVKDGGATNHLFAPHPASSS